MVHERQGVPRLTAYVVMSDAADSPSAAELRGMLVARLPRYMIPQRIVIVDEIPLTTNGKLDEAALAAIDVGRRRTRSNPNRRPPTEAALAELLSEMLHNSANRRRTPTSCSWAWTASWRCPSCRRLAGAASRCAPG